jgi:DNA-binding transcriptional LysR family regulator
MKNADLNDILAFVAVGRSGSFTKAGYSLGVPKSYVSRKITQLEARLIERTTRTVLLTEAGAQYFAVCEKALSDIDEQEKTFDQTKQIPSGRLRITCPVEFGAIITSQLCNQFLMKYPEIQMEILATNTVLDLVRDKVDVAIRPMQLADPSMKSVHVGDLEWGLYASPHWVFANSHLLDKIDSLQVLDIIAFNPGHSVQKKFRLPLFRKDRKKIFEYTPKVIASNLSILIEAASNGVGLAPLPDILIQQSISEKKLVRVFDDWCFRKEAVVAVFVNQKNVPSRVRVLIDFMKEHALFEDCVPITK